MNISSDTLVARFQKDWPKEFEITFRRMESELLHQRITELENKEAPADDGGMDG